eukprot:TRINITY_DN1593_c0_g1_i4.p3 TRINITY_DN1593_c0_g1~~TRINITY_DN1593_c0_g1_i4.p3  ORF type:complete len:144 (+),score=33.93 TRINITY_DN1593_c0_g1_i4:932-1363(+)
MLVLYALIFPLCWLPSVVAHALFSASPGADGAVRWLWLAGDILAPLQGAADCLAYSTTTHIIRLRQLSKLTARVRWHCVRLYRCCSCHQGDAASAVPTSRSGFGFADFADLSPLVVQEPVVRIMDNAAAADLSSRIIYDEYEP